MKSKTTRISLIIGLSLLAGIFLYREPLLQVILSTVNREQSSHGIFVPFLIGYMIWEKLNVFRDLELGIDLRGLYLIGLAVVTPFVGYGTYQLHYIFFVVLVLGLILVFLGKHIFKEALFPIFFLAALTPMTADFYARFADYARHITFGGSLAILSLFDIPFYKDGWLLKLPNALAHVSEGCSGIRYIVSYFIFGTAYAYLIKSTLKGRLAVILASLPLALSAGILRLATIFLATYYISPKMVESRPHIIISWIVFFVMLVLGISADQYVQRRLDRRKEAVLSVSPDHGDVQRANGSRA